MPLDKNTPVEFQPVRLKDLRVSEAFVNQAELIGLREQLKALGDNTLFRQYATIGETIATAMRESSAFLRIVEMENEHRRRIELITRPLADIVAAHAREMSATAQFFQGIEERFTGMRAMFAALEGVNHLRLGFPEFAFRGFAELQRAGGDFLAIAQPDNRAESILADRELSLSGAVAVAASEIEAPEIEVRTVQIVETVDAVLSGRLKKLRSGLVEHWQGARDALATSNPNRVSLVSYSLRELAKGTVNALVAPEEADFQLWVKQQPGGKVSIDWKARFLLYR